MLVDMTLKRKLPRHIAIIMDGNGRWAENQNRNRYEGHEAGLATVRLVIESCLQQGIPYLSLFAFSSENWFRPENEVNFLMQLFLQAMQKEVSELHTNEVRLEFIGDKTLLSDAIQNQMHAVETLTANNTKLYLSIAINYGGRWDIVQAAQKIAKAAQAGKLSVESINESVFNSYLSTKNLPDPDFFIRTSGEQRISNFFLWQMAYTELYFTDIFWPDFTREAFEQALENFSKRQRRYGKTPSQAKADDHV